MGRPASEIAAEQALRPTFTAAARAHLAAGKEGTNGATPDQVQIAVAVEPAIPEHLQGDGEEAALKRWGYELPDDDVLEAMLNPGGARMADVSDEDKMMHELGFDEAEPSQGGRSE